MPKTTVAQLEAIVAELTIRVEQLTTVNRHQTHAMHAMGKNLKGVRAELKRLHEVNGGKTAHRPTARKATAPDRNQTKPKRCTVPGSDHETHANSAELNACWQAHYAAKANAA